MCQECRHYPCHPMCPNYKAKFIDNCIVCKEEIYSGTEMWNDLDGNAFCSEECAKKYHGIKEVEN